MLLEPYRLEAEVPFTKRLILALGLRPDMRVHRQNVGNIPVRDQRGKIVRMFDAGPPVGASDISGIVIPEGWRLEIELKAPDKKRPPAQRAWARMITNAGGVYVFYEMSTEIDDADNLLAAVQAVEVALQRRRERGR